MEGRVEMRTNEWEWTDCYAAIMLPELHFRHEMTHMQDGRGALAAVALEEASIYDEPDREAGPGHKKHILRVLEGSTNTSYYMSLPNSQQKRNWFLALTSSIKELRGYQSADPAPSSTKVPEGKKFRLNVVPTSQTYDPESPYQNSSDPSPLGRTMKSVRNFAMGFARALSPVRGSTHEKEEQTSGSPMGTPRQRTPNGLEVNIMYARNLPHVDRLGSCDPYVVVEWSSKKYQTTVKKNDTNPVWHKAFSFETDIEPVTDDMQITVKDWNRLRADTVVGYIVIPAPSLNDILSNQFTYQQGCELKDSLHEDADPVLGPNGDASTVYLQVSALYPKGVRDVFRTAGKFVSRVTQALSPTGHSPLLGRNQQRGGLDSAATSYTESVHGAKVVHEGYAERESKTGLMRQTTWKRAYVVLTTRDVKFYDSKDSYANALGHVRCLRVDALQANAVQVHRDKGAGASSQGIQLFDSGRKKEFRLVLASEAERDTWLDHILNVIDNLAIPSARASPRLRASSSHYSSREGSEGSGRRHAVDAAVLRWRMAAQEELGERMQLSKERRAVLLDLDQTGASIAKSAERRGNELEHLLRLRGQREELRHGIARAQAALAVLEVRVAGEEEGGQEGQSMLTRQRQGRDRWRVGQEEDEVMMLLRGEEAQGEPGDEGARWAGGRTLVVGAVGDDGGSGGGVGGREVGDLDAAAREMAREKEVHLRERMRLLEEHGMMRDKFERLRGMRARAENKRARWVASRMSAQEGEGRAGGGGGGGREREKGGGELQGRGAGEAVWGLLGLGTLDWVVGRTDGNGRVREAADGAEAEVEGSQRGGGVASESSGGVESGTGEGSAAEREEREQERQALRRRSQQLAEDNSNMIRLLQAACADKRIMLNKLCLNPRGPATVPTASAPLSGHDHVPKPLASGAVVARLAQQLILNDARLLLVVASLLHTWERLQSAGSAVGFLAARCGAEQEAVDRLTERTLVRQRETMRLRRMALHASAVAAASPQLLTGLGIIVADRPARVPAPLHAYPTVLAVAQRSDAAADGVQVGDEIVEFDGHSTREVPASLLMQVMQGEPGTVSCVSFRRLVPSAGRRGQQGREGAGAAAGVELQKVKVLRTGDVAEMCGAWLEKLKQERVTVRVQGCSLEDLRMEVARLAGRAAAGEQELHALHAARGEAEEKRRRWRRRNLASHLAIDRLVANQVADTGRGFGFAEGLGASLAGDVYAVYRIGTAHTHGFREALQDIAGHEPMPPLHPPQQPPHLHPLPLPHLHTKQANKGNLPTLPPGASNGKSQRELFVTDPDLRLPSGQQSQRGSDGEGHVKTADTSNKLVIQQKLGVAKDEAGRKLDGDEQHGKLLLNPDTLQPMEYQPQDDQPAEPAEPAWYDLASHLWKQEEG